MTQKEKDKLFLLCVEINIKIKEMKELPLEPEQKEFVKTLQETNLELYKYSMK